MAEFDELRPATPTDDQAGSVVLNMVDPGGEMRWWMPVWAPIEGLEASGHSARVTGPESSNRAGSNSSISTSVMTPGALLPPPIAPIRDIGGGVATRVDSDLTAQLGGPLRGKYVRGDAVDELFAEDEEIELLTGKIKTQRRTALAIALVLLISLASTGSVLYYSRVDLRKAHIRSQADAARLKREQQQAAELSTEKAALIAQLTQTKNDLESTKQNLSGQVTTRGEDVKTLKACLDGVTKALVQAGSNDVTGAQGTLSGINDACSKAQQISG